MHWIHANRKSSTIWAALILCPTLYFPAPLQARDDRRQLKDGLGTIMDEEALFPIDPVKLSQMLTDADEAERRFNWDKAFDVYDRILRLDRNLPEVRAKYLHALRRTWQSRRHNDPNFRKEVLSLDFGS